jgi:hypothetical protein
MNDKKYTLIVVLLTIIATTLVLGSVYMLVNSSSSVLDTTELNEQEVEELVDEDDVAEIEDPETEYLVPIYEVGDTVVVSEDFRKPRCSEREVECNKVLVTTEVDITEPSYGDELTGRFYIRAYNGPSYIENQKLEETQITQNFNPFNGDGGSPIVIDTAEILTIKATDANLPDDLKFKDKFYLEYIDSAASWSIPGYTFYLKNEGEESTYSKRFLDVGSFDGELSIGFPQ